MPRLARLGDTHTGTCDHGEDCCPHGVSGPIDAGSPNVNAQGASVARVGDAVSHNCPHCGTGTVSSGSGSVYANGIPVARIGDSVTYPGGSGTIVDGADTVFAG